MTRKFSLAKLQGPKLTQQLGAGKNCSHGRETFKINEETSEFLGVAQSCSSAALHWCTNG